MRQTLTLNHDNDKEIARNQYRATLDMLSFEALYKLAWEEHRIRGRVTAPKSELIDKILEAKYGKETDNGPLE